MPLFTCPPAHKAALEEVKEAVGIEHPYLDGWVYLFLSNKKFNIVETIAKLRRRDDMERNVFAKYSITPSLKESMRAGIVQYIGQDKEGRPVLYFNTARDSPRSDQRPERQANLDMFLSWSLRVDPSNPTSSVTWLINQKDASMLRNVDLIFQKDMALRISKFFPGVIAKMYICNMSSALTFVMKPLLRQLPKAISECIYLFSAGDIKRGKLLEVISPEVLPVAMGGKNTCDGPKNYEWFATTIEKYFDHCLASLAKGISIKEMEMMDAYPVDQKGRPRDGAAASGVSGAATASSSTAIAANALSTRTRRLGGDEQLDEAEPETIAVQRDESTRTFQLSSTIRPRSKSRPSGATLGQAQVPATPGAAAGDEAVSPASPTGFTAAQYASLVSGVSNMSMQMDVRQVAALFANTAASAGASTSVGVPPNGIAAVDDESGGGRRDSGEDGRAEAGKIGTKPSSSGAFDAAVADGRDASITFTEPHLELIERPAFTPTADDLDFTVCEWAQFRCYCVELFPVLVRALGHLRDERVSVAPAVALVESNRGLIEEVATHFFSLFPGTRQRLPFPLIGWTMSGLCTKYSLNCEVHDRVQLDCTSPVNFLLSAQVAALQFVEETDQMMEADNTKEDVFSYVLEEWSSFDDRHAFERLIVDRLDETWQQLVPHFQRYIEAKVTISIANFAEHYGLLVGDGRVDTTADWYRTLFRAVVQFKEMYRKSWIFHVFPPLFRDASAVPTAGAFETPLDSAADDAPPTMVEMLEAYEEFGGAKPTFEAVCSFVCSVNHSLDFAKEQMSVMPPYSLANRNIVERYLAVSEARISIPFESQATGSLPADLAEAEKERACEELDRLSAPLAQFLRYSAIHYLFRKRLYADWQRDHCVEVLQRMNRRNARMMTARKEARHQAFLFASSAHSLGVGPGSLIGGDVDGVDDDEGPTAATTTVGEGAADGFTTVGLLVALHSFAESDADVEPTADGGHGSPTNFAKAPHRFPSKAAAASTITTTTAVATEAQAPDLTQVMRILLKLRTSGNRLVSLKQHNTK